MADRPGVTLVQFSFAGGIKEGQRDELLEPGQGWATLENGRQDHVGGYSTRHGFDALSVSRYTMGGNSVSYKLLSHASTTCRIVRGTDLYQTSLEVYVPSADPFWRVLSRVPEASASLRDMPTMGTTATVEDVESVNGYVAVAWTVTSAGSYYAYAAVLDGSTGAIVKAAEQVATLASPSPPLLAKAGNRFFLIAYNAANTLSAWTLDTSSAVNVVAAWTSLGALATDVDSTDKAFAVCSMTGKCALFYADNSGGTDRATLKTFDSTGVLATASVYTNSTTPTHVDVDGEAGTTIWLAWDEGTNIKIEGRNATTIGTVSAIDFTVLTVSVSATKVHVVQDATTPTKARVWVNELPVSSVLSAKMRGVATSGGATVADGSAVSVPAAQMAGKPFMYSGRYYSVFFGAESTNDQDNLVVCDWTENVTYLRPVATFAPGLSVESAFGRIKFRQYGSTAKYHSALNIKRSGVADGSSLAELDFASSTRWIPASHGASLYLSGGLLSYFDGQRVAEAGFLLRPKQPTATLGGTGVTGKFKYIAVYEEVDADGNWHQSGASTPSAEVDATGGNANKTITLSTTPLSISSRLGSAAAERAVRVAWYRTSGVLGTGAYCRLGTSINSTAATTVTYADTDTTYTMTGAKLYSQPGVIGTAQDKRPPPFLSTIVSYNGMLVGASGSDVWYSGQDVSGEGTWFNPIFQVPVPGSGDITALWVQDGTLFAAKRRDIFAISGEAPSDNGMAGGLGTPRRLAVDVGCIEPRSPCTTAIGTFFQSERGIELLTRAQSVEWVGGDVQDTANAYPICTSITVDAASNSVLVELASAEASGLVSGSGRTLVYDLALRQWVSVDRRNSRNGVADTPSQSACMIYTGTAWRYAWTETGAYAQVTSTAHTHADGTIIAKQAVSPWVKASGPQGHHHVNKALLLAKYHTPHDLQMSFAYDYSSTFKAARTFTAAQLLALNSATGNQQLEHGMHNEARGESVRVKLQDATPSSGTLGTGQGATWIALAFEVVPEQGAYKLLPDAAR